MTYECVGEAMQDVEGVAETPVKDDVFRRGLRSSIIFLQSLSLPLSSFSSGILLHPYN
jgi:hypothetical protein